MILTRQDRIDLAASCLVTPEAREAFRVCAATLPELSVFWDTDLRWVELAGDNFSIEFTDYE